MRHLRWLQLGRINLVDEVEIVRCCQYRHFDLTHVCSTAANEVLKTQYHKKIAELICCLKTFDFGIAARGVAVVYATAYDLLIYWLKRLHTRQRDAGLIIRTVVCPLVHWRPLSNPFLLILFQLFSWKSAPHTYNLDQFPGDRTSITGLVIGSKPAVSGGQHTLAQDRTASRVHRTDRQVNCTSPGLVRSGSVFQRQFSRRAEMIRLVHREAKAIPRGCAGLTLGMRFSLVPRPR